MATKAKKLEEQRPPFPAEEYRRLIHGLELESIHLTRCSAKVDRKAQRETESSPLELTMSDDASFEHIGERVVISHAFTISGKAKRRVVLRLEAEFQLEMTSQVPFTEQFFDVYKRTSLRLNTVPYFRELVSSMTTRLGMSPLYLPLFKIG